MKEAGIFRKAVRTFAWTLLEHWGPLARELERRHLAAFAAGTQQGASRVQAVFCEACYQRGRLEGRKEGAEHYARRN